MDPKKSIEVATAIGGGAAGGVFAYLAGLATLGVAHSNGDLALSALGGVIAALIAIYLFTSMDPTNRMRFFVFALVCGIWWQGILQSAHHLVEQQSARREVTSAGDEANAEADRLAAALHDKTPPAQVQQAAAAAAVDGARAVLAAGPSPEPDVASGVKKVVDALQDAHEVAPEAANQGLALVREAALQAGNDEVADMAQPSAAESAPPVAAAAAPASASASK